eukprot:13878449-Ditylum_brightwellii.AAC.1
MSDCYKFIKDHKFVFQKYTDGDVLFTDFDEDHSSFVGNEEHEEEHNVESVEMEEGGMEEGLIDALIHINDESNSDCKYDDNDEDN